MSVKSELIEKLETFGYPVFLQGTLNPNDQYPDSFFTFWNFTTPEDQFYDNAPNCAIWGFWIYFYSVDPELVETVPERARALLKSHDYILAGRPNDVDVDRPTHTGRIFTVYTFENYESEV